MAYESYEEFKKFRNEFKENLKRSKLLKNLKLYYKFKLYNKAMKISNRKSLKKIYIEYKKYRKDALIFKSDDLSNFLSNREGFNKFDKYKSSRKLSAIATSNLQDFGAKLDYIEYVSEKIYVRYATIEKRNIVRIQIRPEYIESFVDFPSNVIFNIDGTSYNKNGLDFVNDYFNSSESFTEMIEEHADVETGLIEIIIYFY